MAILLLDEFGPEHAQQFLNALVTGWTVRWSPAAKRCMTIYFGGVRHEEMFKIRIRGASKRVMRVRGPSATLRLIDGKPLKNEIRHKTGTVIIEDDRVYVTMSAGRFEESGEEAWVRAYEIKRDPAIINTFKVACRLTDGVEA